MDGDDFNDLVAVYSDEPTQTEAAVPVVPLAPLDDDDDDEDVNDNIVEPPVRRLKKPVESDDDDDDDDNDAERPAAEPDAAPAEDDDEVYVRAFKTTTLASALTRIGNWQKDEEPPKDDDGGDKPADSDSDESEPASERKKKDAKAKKRRKPRQSKKDGKPAAKRRQAAAEDAGGEKDVVDAAMQAVKARKKSKGVAREYTEDEKGSVAEALVAKMHAAFELDHQSIKAHRPAFEKLKLVDEVCERCAEKALHNALKASDVGSRLVDWLRPIGATSTLPNLTMRSKLYEVIAKLPFDEDDLVKNRLGKLANLLANHRDETPENKKLLGNIIRKWQQNIFSNEDL